MRNWKITLILVLVFTIGAAIISRLFFLQVLNRKFYQAQALGQQAAFQGVTGERGEVFFANDEKILALNNDKWLVYVNPSEIEDKEAAAKVLASIVNIKEKDILADMSKDITYDPIKNRLTEKEVDAIKALDIKGIHLENTPGRNYPQKDLASHIIGFVNDEQEGQYGIEGYYNDILEGKRSFGEQFLGFLLLNPDTADPLGVDGSNLHLTIDYNIQFQAESLLKRAVDNFKIDSGQIIVMDPNTGAIVALAETPNYDPNQFVKESNLEVFQNSSIQKIFEPGSIMKPFTMAAALNEGKITPETTYIDEGSVKVGIETLYNFDKTKKYGTQTMTQVLEKSLNTGAVFAERTLTPTTYLDYFDRFGFGERTGIDLQGEVSSSNANLRNGRDINFATASFGQGVTVTSLQIIRGFCAIANGGRLPKPYIVEKIVNTSGNSVTNPHLGSSILTKETTTKLTQMLISAVDKGFASGAAVPTYYVAGKTGTAQVPYTDKAGYYLDKSIQSFIGFAPALNPRFVALVKLDNPKTGSSGTTAAPLFSELAQYILNYWQVEPDR